MIKFIVVVAESVSRGSGCYTSAQAKRVSDGAVIYVPQAWGSNSARQNALDAMQKAGWFGAYQGHPICYERDNGYPIEWVTVEVGMRAGEKHGIDPKTEKPKPKNVKLRGFDKTSHYRCM